MTLRPCSRIQDGCFDRCRLAREVTGDVLVHACGHKFVCVSENFRDHAQGDTFFECSGGIRVSEAVEPNLSEFVGFQEAGEFAAEALGAGTASIGLNEEPVVVWPIPLLCLLVAQ